MPALALLLPHLETTTHERNQLPGAAVPTKKLQISQHFPSGPFLPEEKEKKGAVTSDTFGAGGGADGVEEEKIHDLDPAIHTFSLAVRECQNRRRQLGFRDRCCGLQEGDACSDTMKKNSVVSTKRLGACPSPGAPSYRHGGAGFPKGWSSERVPLPVGVGRRNGDNNIGMSLMRHGHGRTLPSKWEDAEKWICSPAPSIDSVGLRHHSALVPNHRRPKSKSGPVGSSLGIGSASCANSPLLSGFNDAKARNFASDSPFSKVEDKGGCYSSVVTGIGGGGCGGRSSSTQSEQSIVPSIKWSDMVESCSFPGSHGIGSFLGFAM